jgi:hypothetical protein
MKNQSMSLERKPWSRSKKVIIGVTVAIVLITIPMFIYLFREMY